MLSQSTSPHSQHRLMTWTSSELLIWGVLLLDNESPPPLYSVWPSFYSTYRGGVKFVLNTLSHDWSSNIRCVCACVCDAWLIDWLIGNHEHAVLHHQTDDRSRKIRHTGVASIQMIDIILRSMSMAIRMQVLWSRATRLQPLQLLQSL